MSYAIHPYAVSIKDLQKAIGSENAKIVKKVSRKYGKKFAEIDELDEDEPLRTAEALSRMILKQPLGDSAGYKFGYALEALCDYCGKMLTNRYWSAMGWDWIESIDEVLEQHGVDKEDLRVDPHLAGRGAPVKIPPIDDFPSIGFLNTQEIARAEIAIREIPVDEIDDEEITDSLQEILTWLSHCSARHKDLVCFYY